jgi:hypothetical protein
MSTKALLVVVIAVAALLAATVYMHRPRGGSPARLPQTLHGIR